MTKTRVALVRIDDRLIHGQVAIKWLRAVPSDEIVICDDGVRGDPFLQQVLRMAAPPQARLRVLGVDECAQFLAQEAEGAPQKVFLLCKSPETALALLRRGVSFPSLNVGGIASGPGSKRIHKSVSLTPDQADQLAEIAGMGVQVFFQTVPEPEERPVPLGALIPAARAQWAMSRR